MTDAAGYNIYNLSEKNVQNILNSYFGESGIEYGVIRVTIGGVDFSTHPYTYDDNPNDFNLTKFSLTDEDFKWKIPFVQSALRISKKQIKLFASAWTAPPWMKTNNNYKGNGN
jgi:glucosylceramidase